MKKIKIKFEYGCFPVWIYGERNELIDNNLPESLMENTILDVAFTCVQEQFDSLFLDDGKEFKYIGFRNCEEKENFFKELISAVNLLRNSLSEEFLIEDNLDSLRKSIM